jgi:hypothetical protein
LKHRRTFTFQAEQANLVLVELHVAAASAIEARLLSISVEGAKIRIHSKHAPNLALSKTVRLRFSSPGLERPLEVEAKLHSRHDEDSLRDYGFWFIEPCEIEERLLPCIHKLFERRRFARVQPDPSHCIVVMLYDSATERRVSGQLLEISSGGMAVRIQVEDECQLTNAVGVRAAFTLPTGIPLRIDRRVILRNRTLFGQAVHLGIEFDDALNSNNAWRGAILEYINARQRVRAPLLRVIDPVSNRELRPWFGHVR